MTDTAETKWIAIAELLRPQGRRGEVLAEPLTDLDEMFAEGREIWLAKEESAIVFASPRKLESHFFPTGRNAGRIVMKLSGSESINDAETLSGLQVFIPAEEMPELEPDTWYVRDLVGSTLFDAGKLVGEIVDVQFAVAADGRTRLGDAAPLLEVQPLHDGEEEHDTLLIPLVAAWIDSVDVEEKTIRMNLPPGLTEA
ncbi:MAG: ribosome maturation factor RimM [Acidobacteriaceae bacterium]|nr:ribosome maturation factor RimM [Acidobacteriaceae bacterium]